MEGTITGFEHYIRGYMSHLTCSWLNPGLFWLFSVKLWFASAILSLISVCLEYYWFVLAVLGYYWFNLGLYWLFLVYQWFCQSDKFSWLNPTKIQLNFTKTRLNLIKGILSFSYAFLGFSRLNLALFKVWSIG